MKLVGHFAPPEKITMTPASHCHIAVFDQAIVALDMQRSRYFLYDEACAKAFADHYLDFKPIDAPHALKPLISDRIVVAASPASVPKRIADYRGWAFDTRCRPRRRPPRRRPRRSTRVSTRPCKLHPILFHWARGRAPMRRAPASHSSNVNSGQNPRPFPCRPRRSATRPAPASSRRSVAAPSPSRSCCAR